MASAFVDAYIEAALWSSLDHDGNPLDKYNSAEDLSPASRAAVEEVCEQFETQAGDLIAGKEEQAGHDFWLTRNRHGAGFWDGDWEEPAATTLTRLAHSFGECNVWVNGTTDMIEFD